MTTTVAVALLIVSVIVRAGDVVVVGSAREAPGIAGVRAGIGVRRVVSVTVPTVAPVSPFTPVIDVTVAVCALPS